ncbi:uncharacterized protein J3D65DRAFT_482477 [Phyllosticta citribraziliensis]|uniref:Uncharacterized protein n=1 Tax=Phyllosticta citribraziliensis TaxID=989973 RepID=A0ABR1LKC1_9PEZI
MDTHMSFLGRQSCMHACMQPSDSTTQTRNRVHYMRTIYARSTRLGSLLHPRRSRPRVGTQPRLRRSARLAAADATQLLLQGTTASMLKHQQPRADPKSTLHHLPRNAAPAPGRPPPRPRRVGRPKVQSTAPWPTHAHMARGAPLGRLLSCLFWLETRAPGRASLELGHTYCTPAQPCARTLVDRRPSRSVPWLRFKQMRNREPHHRAGQEGRKWDHLPVTRGRASARCCYVVFLACIGSRAGRERCYRRPAHCAPTRVPRCLHAIAMPHRTWRRGAARRRRRPKCGLPLRPCPLACRREVERR